MAKGNITLELEGFKEVGKVFATLEPKMQKQALRPSLRAGAKVVLFFQKANIPSDTGRWKKSMKIKSLKRSRREIGVNIVSGTRDELGISPDDKHYYPAVIEYGDHRRGIPPRSPLRRGLKFARNQAMNKIGFTLEKKQDAIIKKMKKVK